VSTTPFVCNEFLSYLNATMIAEVAVPAQCSVEGCVRESEGRGLCHAHLLRVLRLGDVLADPPIGRRVNHTCTVEGCDRPAVKRQLCQTHASRLRKVGDVQADKPIRKPPGDRHIHHGYYVVCVPPEMRHLTNGETSCLEHRYVMAQMLGRALYPDESVHHKNGDRLDNRPTNLELWSRWQPRGHRTEDKVAWALDLLRRYAPEVLSDPTPG
jgi:hypothetical protein